MNHKFVQHVRNRNYLHFGFKPYCEISREVRNFLARFVLPVQPKTFSAADTIECKQRPKYVMVAQELHTIYARIVGLNVNFLHLTIFNNESISLASNTSKNC
jgi:hypothetical protein